MCVTVHELANHYKYGNAEEKTHCLILLDKWFLKKEEKESFFKETGSEKDYIVFLKDQKEYKPIN